MTRLQRANQELAEVQAAKTKIYSFGQDVMESENRILRAQLSALNTREDDLYKLIDSLTNGAIAKNTGLKRRQ